MCLKSQIFHYGLTIEDFRFWGTGTALDARRVEDAGSGERADPPAAAEHERVVRFPATRDTRARNRRLTRSLRFKDARGSLLGRRPAVENQEISFLLQVWQLIFISLQRCKFV